MSQQQQQQFPNIHFVVDDLYCKEHWADEEEKKKNKKIDTSIILPHLLLDQDQFYEENELQYLLSKEEHAHSKFSPNYLQANPSLASNRREVVEWILRVNSHYAFSALTAVLSINYLDRFLSSLQFQIDKPWMMQLAGVACLSLAAKVEETQVPLLLDLQVEESKYLFKPKSVRRMEFLVLSTLEWKMNPITPCSFIYHIVSLINNSKWDFVRVFEHLLLSVITDLRFVHYRSSVIGAAITLHVINQLDPNCQLDYYKNKLLGVLMISDDRVASCYQLILENRSNGGPKFSYVSN